MNLVKVLPHEGDKAFDGWYPALGVCQSLFLATIATAAMAITTTMAIPA